MSTPIEEIIRQNAESPASISSDAGSVQQRPLRELIEAARYLASVAAMKSPKCGLRLIKLIPPGGD